MKYVYVLTSSEKDYFYEQCLISVVSLKKYHPDSEIVILADDITTSGLKGFRSGIKEYALIKEVQCDTAHNQKVRSRLLKTSVRHLVKGDFLYIDLDTVIAGSLEGIERCLENMTESIGMVLDKHVETDNHYMYMYMYMYMNAKKMGYRVAHRNKHFNSGVMYVKDTSEAYDFFKLWNELYLECCRNGIDTDQTALNEANCRMGGVIKEIDGKWNVQVNTGLKYINEAKILHYLGYQPFNAQNIYFNTLPFILCDGNLLLKVKREGMISKEIFEIIDNPKRAFKTVMIIPEDCVAYKLLFSQHMRVLKFIYVRMHGIYDGMERFYSFLFRKIFGRV